MAGTTAEQDFIAALRDEPIAEIKYLSDGTGTRHKIAEAERQEIVAAGGRFLKATGGDACLVLVGPLVSPVGKDGQRTESAVIRSCLARFGYPETKHSGTIDVILDTLGGSLDSAFKTVLFLSRFTERLRVFIPRRAKSAGTLIAIGANEFHLSPFAELGPLDTQIRDPRNPADRVSALDCYQSVDYVRTFGLSTLGKTFRTLAAETRILIPLAELVNTSADFSAHSIAPILSQVKALDFGGWGRTLRIGERYAQALLSRVGYNDEDSAEIAHQLVYGYTHHPFPIDIEEATEIGLKPSVMTEDEYESSFEIVRLCAQPGIAVVGFAEEEDPHLDGLAMHGPSAHSAEQATECPAEVGPRGDSENVEDDSKASIHAWIEEGERISDDEELDIGGGYPVQHGRNRDRLGGVKPWEAS
ncbi:MAG: SDH family Clp fold serine proteinase [Ktedonobacterales bacterium]